MTNTQGQTGSFTTSVSSNQGPYQPAPLIFIPAVPRDPTTADVGYPIGQWWFNPALINIWFHVKDSTSGGIVVATWIKISSGMVGDVEGLTGNTGGEVFPTLGNINTVGDATSITVAGNPGTSTLTASVILPTTNDVLYSANTSPETIGGVALNSTIDPQVLAGRLSGVPVAANVIGAGSVTVGFTDGNPATITITGTAASLTYTDVVGPVVYVVLPADEYISCNSTAGAITLQFPDAPADNRTWTVKDRTGTASTNNITITTVTGADLIDGVTSYLLKGNFDAVNLLAKNNAYEVF